jgi:hypothetical protein
VFRLSIMADTQFRLLQGALKRKWREQLIAWPQFCISDVLIFSVCLFRLKNYTFSIGHSIWRGLPLRGILCKFDPRKWSHPLIFYLHLMILAEARISSCHVSWSMAPVAWYTE